jgi:hypothetical protein
MPQAEAPLIVSALGIVGTLVGVVVGHVLSQSWQKKQWVLDNRKQEVRELLIALSETVSAEMMTNLPFGIMDPADRNRIVEAQARSFRSIRGCVFIARDLDRIQLEQNWVKALGGFEEDRDTGELNTTFMRLRDQLLQFVLGKAAKP